jgi:hypothetical protein
MKMNITFCASSIPNQRMVNGINAATGKLRPNSASGAPVRLEDAPRTGRDPERNADQNRQPEAKQDALQCGGDALNECPLVQQAAEAAEHFTRTGQHHR